MAKKRVGILHMLLTADTRKFSRGMRGAIKQVKALGAAVGKATIKFVKYGAVLAGAAVAGLAFLVKQQFSALDVIAKTSDRLGIQTEALIALQHAASEAGIESAVMTKGLERMNVAIGEIVTGTALEAKAAFDFIGLSAKALDKMPGDEAFALIIERILQLESATQRAAIANDILGRAGKKVLSFGKDFTKVLKEARAEIKGIGGLFSRTQLAGIEAANDEFALFQKSISAVAARIAVELAPAIRGLSIALTGVFPSLFGLGSVFGSTLGLLSGLVLFTVDVIENAVDRLKATPKKLFDFTSDFFGVGGQPAQADQRTRLKGEARPSAQEPRQATESAIGRFGEQLQNMFERMQEGINAFGDDVFKRMLALTGPTTALSFAGAFKGKLRPEKDIFGGGLASASELGVVGGQTRFGGGGVHTPTTRGITKIANNSDKQVKLLEKIVSNGFGAGLAVV